MPVTGANATAAAAAVVRPVTFAKLELSSGDVLAHDAVGTFTWGGDTYLGVGTLGRVEPLADTVVTRPVSVTLELSGFEPGLLATARLRSEQGAPVTLSLGFLDEDLQLVADPQTWFSGTLDRASAVVDRERAAIQVVAEGYLVRLLRGTAARATEENQKAAHATDTFFDFQTELRTKVVNWGGRTVGGPSGIQPGGAGPGGVNTQRARP